MSAKVFDRDECVCPRYPCVECLRPMNAIIDQITAAMSALAESTGLATESDRRAMGHLVQARGLLVARYQSNTEENNR